MNDLERRVASLEAARGQMIRIGKVVSRDPATATVRVQFPDADGIVSHNIPVMYAKTHKDKIYWLPDIGEQVVCVFLGNGLEMGIVLGSIYSGPDPVPVVSGDKYHMTFEDGTTIDYDRSAHVLAVSVRGDATIQADGVLRLEGNVVQVHAVESFRHDVNGHGQQWMSDHVNTWTIGQVAGTPHPISPPEIVPEESE